MPARFRHAAIVGKYQAQGIRPVLEEIAHFLVDQGLEVCLERDTARATGSADFEALTPEQVGQRCDLAVVVGGDGTMLAIARELAPFHVPVAGDFESEHRSMLTGEVWRDGERIFEGLSLNDVVVSRGASASMVELRVDVDGDFVANLRADGLIVSTPTGSTAYALSAGGPILHPAIGGLVMVPIASHTLSNRPIVLPDHGEVRIGVVSGKDVSANFDMHNIASLILGDQVRVRRSQHQVRFLHPRGWSYYATLRRKLRWYEGVV